jgi:hypothetical protein
MARRLTAKELDASVVADLGASEAQRMAGMLNNIFPSGFNCWAVPTGAKGLFNRIRPGDVFLLIGRVQIAPFPDGAFDYCANIELAWPQPLPITSQQIWGEPRWPFIFFFEGKPTSLPWPVFLKDANYRAAWNPQGRFYRVNPAIYHRLPGGDPDGYLRHILQKYP